MRLSFTLGALEVAEFGGAFGVRRLGAALVLLLNLTDFGRQRMRRLFSPVNAT
jgi:hypothetical protein